jgi:hypothetical protein
MNVSSPRIHGRSLDHVRQVRNPHSDYCDECRDAEHAEEVFNDVADKTGGAFGIHDITVVNNFVATSKPPKMMDQLTNDSAIARIMIGP